MSETWLFEAAVVESSPLLQEKINIADRNNIFFTQLNKQIIF